MPADTINERASTVDRRLLLDEASTAIWRRTLAAGEVTPWHWHREVTDNFVAAEGRLAVDTEDERKSSILSVGGICVVPPRVRHRVRNLGDAAAIVITVQTGGARDFNTDEAPA